MKKLKQIVKKFSWVNIAQLAIVATMVLAPVLVTNFASAAPIKVDPNKCPSGIGIACNTTWTVESVFQLILQIAIGIAFLISVLVLVYGGFLYITAAGNGEQATKGRQAIVSALIGLAIVFFSYVVVSLVYRFIIAQST